MLRRAEAAARWANGRLEEPRVAAATVLAATVAVFALRLPSALSSPAGGADYGHYLATVHWIVGAEPSQFGHEGLYGYHLVLAAMVALMPEPTATAVSGPLVASLLLPATFVLARRVLPPLVALGVAGAVPLQQNISDMVAWGGNPNLLAVAFSLVMWRYALEVVAGRDQERWLRPAVLGGAFLGLTVLTHSLTAFITILELVLFGAAVALYVRAAPWRVVRSAAVLAAVAAAVSLPAAPTYLTTASSGVLYGPAPDAGVAESAVNSLAYLFRDTPLVWAAAAAVAAAASAVLAKRREVFGLFLALALFVPVALALTVFTGNMNRAFYYLDVPVTFGLGFGAVALWRGRSVLSRAPAAARRPAVLAVVLALMILVPVSSVERHQEAVGFYGVLTEDHLEAMEWIRSNSAAGEGVWTDGVAHIQPYGRTGQMYGFWIDGYARRPSLYTAQPEDLAFDYEQQRARDATRVLQGDLVAENGVLRVGVGPSIASTYNPTVGVRDGADYRPVFVALDLGFEAGARTHYLTAGSNATPTALGASAAGFSFAQNATFQAPNNWSGSAAARTTLEGHSMTYEVNATSDRRELPWIHQNFLLGPGLKLEDQTSSADGLNRTFVFDVQRSGKTTSTLRVTVSASGEAANLSARTYGAGLSVRLAVTVSGQSAHPSLRVVVDWPDGQDDYGPPGPVEVARSTDLLAAYGVRYLFIENEQAELITRFTQQADDYRVAFQNGAVTVIERLPAG